MVGKKTPAVVARRQARERLARERAEQAERNRKNEADLIDYIVLEQRIAAADTDRDAAIKSARERHQAVVKELKQQQVACLARMSQRGDSSVAIADRVGLTSREVKQLIGQTPHARARRVSASVSVESGAHAAKTVVRRRGGTGDGDPSEAACTAATNGGKRQPNLAQQSRRHPRVGETSERDDRPSQQTLASRGHGTGTEPAGTGNGIR